MSVELVEVDRSGFRECVHRGSLVVRDGSGEIHTALGNVHSPIFPRSSNKPMQAVTMLRHGFVPASEAELAISTASHQGEPEQVELVRALLRSHGLDESALQCPADLPGYEPARAAAIRAGTAASPVFMNCSGKHAAMLATCEVNGWPVDSYLSASHPLQVAVADTIADLTGEPEADLGIDGCGLPIVPVALANLAGAFGAMVTADEGTPERAVADAVRQYPVIMSGTGQADALLMAAVPGLFCKAGADGVYAGALPDGSCFAFKIDDGHPRARVPLAAALLRALGATWTEDLADLAASPVLGGSFRVGTVRAVPGIFGH